MLRYTTKWIYTNEYRASVIISVTSLQNTMNGRFAAFLPSVEVDLGQEIFLPADPWTLLKSGKIADVPVMAGITADESAYFVQSNHRYDIMHSFSINVV